jgi:hypothetical protein
MLERGAGTCNGGTFSVVEVNMATPPPYILVRLWVHRGPEAEFEVYERKATCIIEKRILRGSPTQD